MTKSKKMIQKRMMFAQLINGNDGLQKIVACGVNPIKEAIGIDTIVEAVLMRNIVHLAVQKNQPVLDYVRERGVEGIQRIVDDTAEEIKKVLEKNF